MISETRQIKPFTKIHLRDFGTIILSQGNSESLTIEADQEMLPELISEVREDTLFLGVDDDWVNRIGKVISSVLSGDEHKVIYHLTCVDLSEIKVSGKCTLKCDSLTVQDLTLNVAGLGNMVIKALDCHSLDTHAGGRGEFSITGRAEQQNIRISGSADYNAPNLTSKDARIVISGQGNVTLKVQKNLDITISGFGQVNYYGQPKIRQVISGFGKSKRLNEN